MCDKCDELDKRIERLELLPVLITTVPGGVGCYSGVHNREALAPSAASPTNTMPPRSAVKSRYRAEPALRRPKN
jgi:hypothetical protein